MAFNRFLRLTYGRFLTWRYRIVTENQELINNLKPPFLVLPNHASVLDPFMLNSWVPRPIHYVVSDASFRSRLVSFGLSLVGSIPKTKAMSDLETIKNIVRVRDRGGVIGIFPEGQNSWDGHSLPIYYSTAKLAKLLKIPVVTVRIAGAYFSKPRWAKQDRRGQVHIRFELAYTPDQLKRTPVEEIDRTVVEMLDHDEFEYNRTARVAFAGKDRAEYLERVLFICPSCTRIGTLHSQGDEFACTECGYRVYFDRFGFFKERSGRLRFQTIRDWNLWQREEYERHLYNYVADEGSAPLLAEERVLVQIGYKSLPLAPFHTGSLQLYADRIVLFADSGEKERFEIAEINGSNIQNNEHWEFYDGPDLFRITFLDPGGCTYKWDHAVRYIKQSTCLPAKEAIPSQ